MSYVYGLDVDFNQDVIDWKSLKKQGFQFVYVQATHACWEVRTFRKQWQGAKEAGFLRGAYHFFDYRDSTADCIHLNITQQKKIFLDTLADDPGELPPALDVEGINVNKQRVPADRAKFLREIKDWLSEVGDKMDRTPVIYTRASYWEDEMNFDPGPSHWAAKYNAWLAHYFLALPHVNPKPLLSTLHKDDLEQIAEEAEKGLFVQSSGPDIGQAAPRIPTTWDAPGWKFWQITGDKYFIQGVGSTNEDNEVDPAGVDICLFHGSQEDLFKFAGMTPPGRTEPITIDSEPTQPEHEPVVADSHSESLPVQILTNQQMINAFFHAFGLLSYWDIIKRVGLQSLANQPSDLYTGPAVETLPLADFELAALILVLSRIDGIGAAIHHTTDDTLNNPADAQAPGNKDRSSTQGEARLQAVPGLVITNQQMINAFAKAFGDADYWEIIKRLHLEGMAKNRSDPYAGPKVEKLALTEAEKTALKKALG